MRKTVAVLVGAIISALLSLAGAYNFDRLLSGQPEQMSISPLIILSGLGNGNVVKLFFLLFGCCILFIMFALLSTANVDYKSKMREVTPDLEIPQAEGQGQYGTAEFLHKSRYEKVWAVVQVSEEDERIRRLMAQGRNTERGKPI